MILFSLFWLNWLQGKKNRTEASGDRSFIVKSCLTVTEKLLEWRQGCAKATLFLCVSAFFKCSEPMRKFSLADPPNLNTVFFYSASKTRIGLKAKGTVVYPSLSNFNVYMNNIEILSDLWFCISNKLPWWWCCWSVDQSCVARCVQVNKKLIIEKITS